MEACRKSGQPIPPAILNKPTLNEGLDLYLKAYFALDSERTHAEGARPIPWSKMVLYAETYGFDEDLLDDFVHLLTALDNANMVRINNDIERRNREAIAKSKSGSLKR